MKLRPAVGGFVALTALAACSSDNAQSHCLLPARKGALEYFEKGFENAHPEVDVQGSTWDPGGSGGVRAEKPNPQADVWFGAPAEAFDRATKEDLLQPYKPTWAAALDAEGRDAGDNWYGTYLTPEVIGYNREAVKEADAPKDWDDLIDPKWKGKIVIRDPIASGTMRAIFGAIMARSIAQTGKPDAGYEWLRKLDANTREYTLNPTILYQKLGRQEGVVTMWDMPDIATLEQRTRIPVRYSIPSSGTPLLVDGIAVVRGSKHPRREGVLRVRTTPEAMIAAADSFLRIPARRTYRVQAPRVDWDAMAQIKPMPVDRRVMAEHLDEWMKYWDANIRNRGSGRPPRRRRETEHQIVEHSRSTV